MSGSLTISQALAYLESARRFADAQAQLTHLRWMILARAVDDRTLALYKSGELTGNAFLGKGQEALAAAIGMHIHPPGNGRRGDIFAPLIRDLAARLAFGEEVVDVFRTHLMKRTGPMRGRDGNVHRGDIAKGTFPMISHLGAMIAPVVGTLLARRIRGELTPGNSCVGVATIGDGGMATGASHEGLNTAAIERLPFVLVVANNQFSYSTHNDRSFACRDLVDRAIGYGLQGTSCDGTDSVSCLVSVGSAIQAAREGQGPQMVVASLLRLSGHGTHDDAAYVPQTLKARFGDGLELTQARLLALGHIDQKGLAAMWDEARAQVASALVQARSEADPQAQDEDWTAYSDTELAHRLTPRPDGPPESLP